MPSKKDLSIWSYDVQSLHLILYASLDSDYESWGRSYTQETKIFRLVWIMQPRGVYSMCIESPARISSEQPERLQSELTVFESIR